VVVLAMRCERSHTAKANNKFDEFLAKLSKWAETKSPMNVSLNCQCEQSLNSDEPLAKLSGCTKSKFSRSFYTVAKMNKVEILLIFLANCQSKKLKFCQKFCKIVKTSRTKVRWFFYETVNMHQVKSPPKLPATLSSGCSQRGSGLTQWRFPLPPGREQTMQS
jgi:hypothetical protein